MALGGSPELANEFCWIPGSWLQTYPFFVPWIRRGPGLCLSEVRSKIHEFLNSTQTQPYLDLLGHGGWGKKIQEYSPNAGEVSLIVMNTMVERIQTSPTQP